MEAPTKTDRGQKGSASPVTIADIRVNHVGRNSFQKKKKKKSKLRLNTSADLGEEETWLVHYAVLLNCKTPNRILIKSDQQTWLLDDPAEYMKNKARNTLVSKVDSWNIDLNNDIRKYFMESDAPWECMWAKAEIDILKLKEEVNKKSSQSKLGHNKSLPVCNEW